MKKKDYIQANRKSWNEVAAVHHEAKKKIKEKFFVSGYACLDELVTRHLESVGLKGKRVAQLCCNDGLETLSIKNLGASSCVGFDISDHAIEQAKQLAADTGITCDFVQTDICEIPERYDHQFDLIYISSGSLIWFPDLQEFFQVVNRLLARNGKVLIYDIHPLLFMLDEKDRDNPLQLKYSYFIEEPRVYDDGLDYVSNTAYESAPHYVFDPTLSQVISAVIANKLQLEKFEEFPHDISALFPHLAEQPVNVPASYILIAEKQGDFTKSFL
ncbi:class I SAM-dependent methyltransferase [Bacillus sp. FSL W7-1360]